MKDLFSPESGRALKLISAYVDHGRDWNFFLRAAQICAAQLFANNHSFRISEDEPILSFSFAEYAVALGDMTPPPLSDTLLALPFLELTMFAALVRLVGRQTAATIGASVTFSSVALQASSSITLRLLLLEFKKLIHRKDLTYSQLVNVVRSLSVVGLLEITNPAMKQSTGADFYNDETCIYMVPSLQEAYDVFSGDAANAAAAAAEILRRGGRGGRVNESFDFDDLGVEDESLKLMYCHRGSHNRIKVPQVVRRAVLEPLEPIEWTLGAGDRLVSKF